MPEVPTVDGIVPLSMLPDDGKLVHAATAVQFMSTTVLERSKDVQGLNTAKCAEAIIATDSVLVNLGEKTVFGVL